MLTGCPRMPGEHEIPAEPLHAPRKRLKGLGQDFVFALISHSMVFFYSRTTC